MNKQKLLDQAIEDWQGVYKPDCPFVYGYTGPKNYTACAFGLLPSYGYIFSQTEFEKRAKWLGWINGYKWGVEYPTNGKKPDLDDDVVVYYETKDLRSATTSMIGLDFAIGRTNEIKSFRIVDQRYKPKEPEQQTKPDNSWHERGELPPVGVECEYSNINGKWMKVIPTAFGSYHFLFLTDDGKDRVGYLHAECFRPIKSEREKFVEAALAKFDTKKNGYPPTNSEWLTKLFGEMYDSGCRFVSRESRS